MRYTKDTKKNKPHPNEGCAAKEICYAGHYACCLHCALSCCHGRHDREGHERLIDSFFHLSIRIAISRSPNRRLYCALPVVFYVSDSTHTPAFPARQESPADRFAIPRPGRPLNFLVQRAVFAMQKHRKIRNVPFPRPCGATGNDAQKLHAPAFAHFRDAAFMHEVSCPPQRQKKPAALRFLRGGESSIFAGSFFLSKL